MSKEKVFIVLIHKNSLKVPTQKGQEPQWEVEERVEFVNQLRKKHLDYNIAIADYMNRKMVAGTRYGMNDYDKFEQYIRNKYPEQLKQLDTLYREQQIVAEDTGPELFMDRQGNLRPRTVFDVAV